MRIIAAATLALFAVAAPAAAQSPRPECPGADLRVGRDLRPAKAAVLCIVNAERAARALPPVAAEPRLEAAAQGHADDMVARDYFDHVTPEGRTPADRVDATGYPHAFLHENLAIGQRTPRGVMTGWMRSEGHCRGVLAPEPVHLGVGIAPQGRPGPAWTQVFGRPHDSAPPSQDTTPASGCPYERLSIAPGPAPVAILALGRTGRRVTVFGRLEDEGGGRRIVIEARRAGRRVRRAISTRFDGSFRTTLRAPRGRGRVRVTAIAPAVPDVYERGSDTRRI